MHMQGGHASAQPAAINDHTVGQALNFLVGPGGARACARPPAIGSLRSRSRRRCLRSAASWAASGRIALSGCARP
eukprot:884394-Prymnesium_polylepis.3